MKYKDEISDWVKNHPGELVPYRFQNSYVIFDWIRCHRGEPIPDELKFDGWQTSGYFEKPIHWWIEYRRGEPIPEDIKYDDL